MNYKYNEEKYGEIIKEKGFQTRFIRYELVVLVKYLKKLGYKKKQTEEFLYDFCKKHIEGFNEVKYYRIIDGAIRDGRKKKNPLIVVKDVSIMKKELECIDSLNVDHEYKKLLLSLLVKRKIAYEINKIHKGGNAELSTYFNGTRKTFREVFKAANITKKGYKINDMISKLVEYGVIESIIKGDVILSYMYTIYDTYSEYIEIVNRYTRETEEHERKHIKYQIDEEDVFERIKDFENIGYIFDYYKDDNRIKKCLECGKLIKLKNKSPKKYCDECAKIRKNEQNKGYYSKN